jgi:hypothetical protein
MNEQNIDMNKPLNISITPQDINTLFKYLARVDLKGSETPEFNKILGIFDSRNLAKNQETENKS